MSEDEDCPKEDNPGHVTPDLCEAYRGALSGQVTDIKDNLKRIEGRQWAMLTGVILTIVLTILGICVQVR